MRISALWCSYSAKSKHLRFSKCFGCSAATRAVPKMLRYWHFVAFAAIVLYCKLSRPGTNYCAYIFSTSRASERFAHIITSKKLSALGFLRLLSAIIFMPWDFEDYKFHSETMFVDERGYPRFKHNKKLVHREVEEQKLGRRLEQDEVVHHKNKDKMDFDPSNLQALKRDDHTTVVHGRGYTLEMVIAGFAIFFLLIVSIYVGTINKVGGCVCCPITLILIAVIFYYLYNSKRHVFEAE